MVICSAVDDGYLWAWLIMAQSAKSNSTENDISFVLGNVNKSISPGNVLTLLAVCKEMKIDLKVLDLELALNLKTTHQPILVYAKLMFLDLLEENFIWIDADCLLLPGWRSIDSYFENLMQDKKAILAGTLNGPSQLELEKPQRNKAFIRAGKNYFNSGVFLANPSRWRAFGYASEWKLIGESHRELGFVYHDQDVLNYLLSEKFIPIPKDFNVTKQFKITSQTRVMHFTGKPKPWQFTPNSRSYFLAKDILLDLNQLANEEVSRVKLLKFSMYWQAEDELKQILDYLGFQNLKQVFTNFENNIVLAKRDVLKLRLMQLIAKPWLFRRLN